MTLQRSSRDPVELGRRLNDWLAGELPAGSDPQTVVHGGLDANGMSSETVLLDVTRTDGEARVTDSYVARIAPATADLPVFAEYRLTDQYDAMRLAGELSGIPVPRVGLNEPTGQVLGTPFFLMERLDGVVPPDVLPYNFGDNWLHDASADEQQALQRSSVEVLASLHGIADAATTFAFSTRRPPAMPVRRCSRATSRRRPLGMSTPSRRAARPRRWSSVDWRGWRPTSRRRTTSRCSAGVTPASAT